MPEQFATDPIHLAAFPTGTVFLGDDGGVVDLDVLQATPSLPLEPAVWLGEYFQ